MSFPACPVERLPSAACMHAGQLQDLPAANFSGLPARKVLTLNMDVPEAWLVEPTQAAADLDNVRLADVGGKIAAEYELEAVMLTGSCVATTSGRSERVRCLQLRPTSACK